MPVSGLSGLAADAWLRRLDRLVLGNPGAAPELVCGAMRCCNVMKWRNMTITSCVCQVWPLHALPLPPILMHVSAHVKQGCT